MLEIVVLVVLTNKIGKLAERNGRDAGGYKLLTVVLWFTGELVGALVGLALTGGEMGVPVILLAALGATMSGAVVYFAAGQPIAAASPSAPEADHT